MTHRLPRQRTLTVVSPMLPSILAIVVQVDYYFSPENLPYDRFLLSLMHPITGWVPLSEITKFRRMIRMGATHIPSVAEALRYSTIVEVDSSSCYVRSRSYSTPHVPSYFSTAALDVMFGIHQINKARSVHTPTTPMYPTTSPTYPVSITPREHSTHHYAPFVSPLSFRTNPIEDVEHVPVAYIIDEEIRESNSMLFLRTLRSSPMFQH